MPASHFPGTSLPTARRISFGRVAEHLEVPNLLAIQTESFDWLVDSGLAEILDEISPVEDFSGTMSLSFSAPRSTR